MTRGGTDREPVSAAEPLRVTEIFRSLQGEADQAGWPTVFVRLTGCPLRCRWCDTAYAFTGGRVMSCEEVIAAVADRSAPRVTVTGGEPLAQPGCRDLLRELAGRGYQVSLETSGALDIAGLDPRVTVVMDVKPPGSGQAARNLGSNINHLKPGDQLKFVLADRADYEWARDWLAEQDPQARISSLFSPVFGELAPRDLADWILADGLNVRLQLQLHKLLWGNEPGR
ncbi:MAG: 7-carboxy-7-deazaguanine synthase QueE [Gammaproteobacteria bacterium]|nr:7-carboxy-7-deazaguanine synthase QueE [Gammaproteobacteria bacterium]